MTTALILATSVGALVAMRLAGKDLGREPAFTETAMLGSPAAMPAQCVMTNGCRCIWRHESMAAIPRASLHRAFKRDAAGEAPLHPLLDNNRILLFRLAQQVHT